ncbi:hypothetical protein ACVMIH_005174 [Bradyrhizobium sp. USDA 4503]
MQSSSRFSILENRYGFIGRDEYITLSDFSRTPASYGPNSVQVLNFDDYLYASVTGPGKLHYDLTLNFIGQYDFGLPRTYARHGDVVLNGSGIVTLYDIYGLYSYVISVSVDYAPKLTTVARTFFRDQTYNLSNLFSWTDEQAPSKFYVANQNPRAGHLMLDGTISDAGREYTSDQIAHLVFVTTDSPLQNVSITIKAKDASTGLWGNAATVTGTVQNQKPFIGAAISQSALTGTIIELSQAVVGIDRDVTDTPNLTYTFTDAFQPRLANSTGGGYFTFDGVTKINQTTFTAAELQVLKYKVSGAAGIDKLSVVVSDGIDHSAPASFTITAINRVPVVTSKGDRTLGSEETVKIGALIEAQDPDGELRNLRFEVIDLTDGNGFLKLNGIAQRPHQPVSNLSYEDLSRLEFLPAASDIADKIQIRAYDGIDWSAPVTVSLKGTAFADVAVNHLYTELAKFAVAAYKPIVDLSSLSAGWKPLQLDLSVNGGSVANTINGIFTNANAAALIVVGNMNGARTLVVAYRGSDELRDTADWPLATARESYYHDFDALHAALEKYIVDNGVTQVLLTGHSLGTVPVQLWYQHLHSLYPTLNVQGVTLAPLGAGSGSPNDAIVNFENTNDIARNLTQPINLGGNVLAGRTVDIDIQLDDSANTTRWSKAHHSADLYALEIERIETFLAGHPNQDFLKSNPSLADKAPQYVVLGGRPALWNQASSFYLNAPLGNPDFASKDQLFIGSHNNETLVANGRDILYGGGSGNGGVDKFVILAGSAKAFGGNQSDKFFITLGSSPAINDSGGIDELILLPRPISEDAALRTLRDPGTRDSFFQGRAFIDPSKLSLLRSGNDLLLSYLDLGVSTTIRIVDMGSAASSIERLTFGDSLGREQHYDLKKLWEVAPAAPAGALTLSSAIAANSSSVNGFSFVIQSASLTSGKLDASEFMVDPLLLTRVSEDPIHGALNAPAYGGSVSANGRFVLFNTFATDVLSATPTTAGSYQEIYSRDLKTGEVRLLSTSSTGSPLMGNVRTGLYEAHQALSFDGKYLAFVGNPQDSGWIEGVNTGAGFIDPVTHQFIPVLHYYDNVFVKNLENGQVDLVSYDLSGKGQQSDVAFGGISQSGRYVSFGTAANNLVAGDLDGSYDLFARDITTGALYRVTTTVDNTGPIGSSTLGNFSSDGRYIAFSSQSTKLVAVDTNGTEDVFVRDLFTGQTFLVSIAGDGSQAQGSSRNASISGDGRYVAFESDAPNLVVGDTNGRTDIFLKDTETGEIKRLTAGMDNGAFGPVISEDGRYIVFSYYATPKTNSPFPPPSGGYVYDTATDRIANFTGLIVSDGTEFAIGVSSDGRTLTFGGNGNVYAIANPLYDAHPNWRPTLTVTDQQITAGHAVSAQSLFRATDKNGSDTITTLEFQDLNSSVAGGHFVLNGVSRDSTPFRISPADLSNLTYIAGPADTVDIVKLRVSDGTNWSDTAEFQISAINLTVSELRRESLAPNLLGGNGDSGRSAFSADGRYLVFESQASNLVPGDDAGQQDIFLRDLQSGSTRRLTNGLSGLEANDFSANPSVSGDGKKIVFESWATNLVSGDDNVYRDIFYYNQSSDAITLVSGSVTGGNANDQSFDPRIDANGDAIVFSTLATNIVSNDTNQFADVVLFNIATGLARVVSLSKDGVQGNGDSWGPDLTRDAGEVAFTSYASNLVVGDTNGYADVFVKSLTSGAVVRVSTGENGTQANADSVLRAITPDGRYVLFNSLG